MDRSTRQAGDVGLERSQYIAGDGVTRGHRQGSGDQQ